ncbi:MAG: XrtA-associated tyrosine autokinase [Thermodesulfobacteriota bacterium]
MGKIEKALEKALEMKKGALSGSAVDILEPGPPGAVESGAPPEAKKAIDKSLISEQLVTVMDPTSTIAEEYRKLRTRIFEATEKNFQNTILVTSSCKGEGKSVTAANLAAAIASKLDNTVLLVDCDLRKPTLHTYFGIEQTQGLAEYLTGKIELTDALINTGIGNMIFLPAGKPPENPAELLTSRKMRTLMDEIKNRYTNRYIILDSTPLLSTAEPSALANEADGVLLVVRERFAPRKEVEHAISILNGANILGVLLNCDDAQPRRYYYQY